VETVRWSFAEKGHGAPGQNEPRHFFRHRLDFAWEIENAERGSGWKHRSALWLEWLARAASTRGSGKIPTLEKAPRNHPVSQPFSVFRDGTLPTSMATARIRPWPGPVIAPDVHGSACARHLGQSLERMGRPLSSFKPFSLHWNTQHEFRRRGTSIASTTSLRRRSGWNADPILKKCPHRNRLRSGKLHMRTRIQVVVTCCTSS